MGVLPDVIAFEVAEAKKVLQEAAVHKILVVETKPPRAAHFAGDFRVVRQRMLTDGSVELVVAREATHEGGEN